MRAFDARRRATNLMRETTRFSTSGCRLRHFAKIARKESDKPAVTRERQVKAHISAFVAVAGQPFPGCWPALRSARTRVGTGAMRRGDRWWTCVHPLRASTHCVQEGAQHVVRPRSGGFAFAAAWSGSPLQWRPDRREYLIFSVMPCISERRPLSDTIGAAFVICSRDDPFVVPANNCHREAAEIPAS